MNAELDRFKLRHSTRSCSKGFKFGSAEASIQAEIVNSNVAIIIRVITQWSHTAGLWDLSYGGWVNIRAEYDHRQ